MKVSVIVPVHNTEPYLAACIESILSQRYSDFELLLVDDGSMDASGRICEEFAAKDPRVVVFHQKNGGVCSARNRGLENARGEFVVFVDADDRLTESYLDHLMESDADMVIAGIRMFGAKNRTRKPVRRDDFWIDGLAAHWNTPPLMNYLYCYPVAKRFRTHIIRENGIHFDESLFFSEDMYFNMLYFCYSDSFTELPYSDYEYRIFDITRDEKYKMSTDDLTIHYERLESCFNHLYGRIGKGTLSFVRDNTNLRLMRKLYAFLLQECISADVFVRNMKAFREKDYASYMMGLLKGRKEKRVMREAVRFPWLAYWIENRLKNALVRLSSN